MEMLEKNLQYLQKIDMFGNRIELSYNKEKTHKTKFGGFLTILLLIFSGLAINYFGQEMFNKSEPIVTTEESYMQYSHLKQCCFLNQNTDALFIALRVLDSTSLINYNQYFYANAILYLRDIRYYNDDNDQYGNNNYELNVENVLMENIPCNNYIMINDSIFANQNEYDFNSLLCFRILNNYPLLQQNKIVIERFDLQIIQKETSNIKQGIIELIYSEIALDVSKYNKPGVYYLNKRIFIFEDIYEKRVPLILKQVTLQTDKGIVLTEYDTSSYLLLSILPSISQNNNLNNINNNPIFTFEFEMDRRQLLTRRSYLKIQDFLSSVGGIIKVFSMVFIFLSKKLTKLDFYMNFLNQIFNFEDPYQKLCMDDNDDDDDDDDEDEDDDYFKINQQLKNSNILSHYAGGVGIASGGAVGGNGGGIALNNIPKNLQESDKLYNQLPQLQKSPNKNSKSFSYEMQQQQQNQQIQGEQKKGDTSQEQKNRRKISIDVKNECQEDHLKSDTNIPLIGQKFSKSILQQQQESKLNIHPSFGNILQNTETLIPLQLLHTPNHPLQNDDDDDEGDERDDNKENQQENLDNSSHHKDHLNQQIKNTHLSQKNKNIPEKQQKDQTPQKKDVQEKEQQNSSSQKKDQITIDIQLLKDLEDSDENSCSLKKQVSQFGNIQKKNFKIKQQQYEDEQEIERDNKKQNQNDDNLINEQTEQNDQNENNINNNINEQKRDTQFRRRNAIPKNTMLISKFMHKVRSLLHNHEADTEKIETLKKKLNHQGNTYIQPENKPLKWGFFDYIQNLFCFGKAQKKREQMKYCWKKVKERLNAVYIMQKLVELEKLKILLLDEHQLKLFDYLPKPMISLNVALADQPYNNNSGNTPTQNQRKSNDSKNISPTNPNPTPANPNNTPMSQINLENQQQQQQEFIENNPSSNKSAHQKSNENNNNNFKNSNTDQTDLQNQNNFHKQTSSDNSQKSNSPKKIKKPMSCFKTWSNKKQETNNNNNNNLQKKSREKTQSINKNDINNNNNDNNQKKNINQKKPKKNKNAFHQQWIQLNSHSTPLEKALHAMEAFEMIKNKQIKTEIDIKLVDMLDSRMKKCFEVQDEPAYYEQNILEDQHNMSQFRQFFDGDNTIREFLYPTEQYQQQQQQQQQQYEQQYQQQQNIDGLRKNRRARTVAISSTPRNVSDGTSVINHFNNPSQNNSINQSFAPFNNLNYLLNQYPNYNNNYNNNNMININTSNNFNNVYTPARRSNFNNYPSSQFHSSSKNAHSHHNHDNFNNNNNNNINNNNQFYSNNESIDDFSKCINELQQSNNLQMNHFKINNSIMKNNNNFNNPSQYNTINQNYNGYNNYNNNNNNQYNYSNQLLKAHPNQGIFNRQRSFSPSGLIQAQMKKQHQLQRQKSSLSITSNMSNTNNYPKISSTLNHKINSNCNININNNNNNNINQGIKPSIFLRRLQTYDNNIQEEANYKTQQQKSNYASQQNNYLINSNNSSKKQYKNTAEQSSPQKFEGYMSSSGESQQLHHNINTFNPSINNIRPSHNFFSSNLHSANIPNTNNNIGNISNNIGNISNNNIANNNNITNLMNISNMNNNSNINLHGKNNLNLSAIESDLNTIEEDIPQENNTPTTLSKQSQINESQLRRLNTSFFQQQYANISQSQQSPLKVTEALKKYSINFQTMQQENQK